MQNIDQQVQRALNMDNFDLAKVLREDRQELDADMADLEVGNSSCACRPLELIRNACNTPYMCRPCRIVSMMWQHPCCSGLLVATAWLRSWLVSWRGLAVVPVPSDPVDSGAALCMSSFHTQRFGITSQ